jgi:SAM-dependent methyltransferase
MNTYQSHGDSSESISDTKRKLARLQLPESLAGKRVLDIGCNEGYFCSLAAERGAIEVLGIDFVAANIEFATQRYAREGVRFLQQSWAELPEGPFDLILWVSAMHYELDPRSIVKAIASRLAPDGLLVLECGVMMLPGRSFVPVPRIADTRWYPSRDFLIDGILAGFSVRQVAEPEIADGDFVPRAVFHCRKALPTIILLRGGTGEGKTTLVERLRDSATKVIELDVIVSRMGQNPYPHDPFEKFMVSNYDPTDLTRIYHGIDESPFARQYAEWLSSAVAATDDVVIFEGYISDKQCALIEQSLRHKALVWDMTRIAAEVARNT